MITLIPAVKELSLKSGTLDKKAISFDVFSISARLCKALEKNKVSEISRIEDIFTYCDGI